MKNLRKIALQSYKLLMVVPWYISYFDIHYDTDCYIRAHILESNVTFTVYLVYHSAFLLEMFNSLCKHVLHNII